MPTSNGRETVFNDGIKNNDPRPADTSAEFLVTQASDGAQGKAGTYVLAESTKFNFTNAPIYAWGDSMTDGATQVNYPTQLASLLAFAVTNKGVGGETSTQIKDRLVADSANYSKSVIIWAGNNNALDPTTVKADIATMISTIGHTRYLVVSVINNTTRPIGTPEYDTIIQLNEDLKALYGNKFVDIRKIIVDSYNPSLPQDVIDHENDVAPDSLRIDPTHYNTAGYKIVAENLFQRLGYLYNSPGYLQSKDFKSYFDSLQPVTIPGIQTITGFKTFDITSIVQSGSTGQGLYLKSNLTANANNLLLIGLDVSTSYSAGAFTGVEFYHARYEAGVGSSVPFVIKNNSTAAGASTRYRLSNSANNVDFLIRSTGATSPNSGVISVSNATAKFSFFVGGNEMFNLMPSGAVIIQSGGTVTDNGVDKLQVTGTASGTVDATLSNQFVRKGQHDLKANLASPAFTGTPTAPTATAGTNTTQLATTAFVQSAITASSPNLQTVTTTGNSTTNGIITTQEVDAQNLMVRGGALIFPNNTSYGGTNTPVLIRVSDKIVMRSSITSNFGISFNTDGITTVNKNRIMQNVDGEETVSLSGSATLDFPSTASGQSSELTITVTGASDGDVVALGVPNGSSIANTCYTARVSAANTVTVKHNNYSAESSNPASGVFKVKVFK
jgi:lysophospholipase L1-like esterase